jgi:hypothetical protein
MNFMMYNSEIHLYSSIIIAISLRSNLRVSLAVDDMFNLLYFERFSAIISKVNKSK